MDKKSDEKRMSKHIDTPLDDYIKQNKSSLKRSPDQENQDFALSSAHDRRWSGDRSDNIERKNKYFNDKNYDNRYNNYRHHTMTKKRSNTVGSNQYPENRPNKRVYGDKRPNYQQNRYQPNRNYENRPYNRDQSGRGNYDQQHKPWNQWNKNEQGRYKNDRIQDRNTYATRKFNPRNNFRGPKPFEYRNNGGFKEPKHLTTFQQKRRNLKRLRKTAAQLAGGEKPGTFVYKPGMISILRPSTPLNTTQFISKQINQNQLDDDKFSPKQMIKQSSNDLDRNWVSEYDELNVQCNDCRTGKPHIDWPKNKKFQHFDLEIFDDILNSGIRTPEWRISPKDWLNYDQEYQMSHFSDDEIYYDNDLISGTMEGLVDGNMFDFEQSEPKPQYKRMKVTENELFEDQNDSPLKTIEIETKVRNEFDDSININHIDSNFTVMNLEHQANIDSKLNLTWTAEIPTNDMSKGSSNGNEWTAGNLDDWPKWELYKSQIEDLKSIIREKSELIFELKARQLNLK